MNLFDLIKNAKVRGLEDLAAISEDIGKRKVLGVSRDTNDELSGKVFVCMRGKNFDPHTKVSEILSGGALLVVCDREYAEKLEFSDRVVFVENTREAYSRLYSSFCSSPEKKLKIVGVTGTNGKTTVVNLLSRIFKKAGKKTAVIGTVGGCEDICGVTTPDPEVLYPMLQRLCEDNVEYVFLEASSHALCLDKLAPISFECVIFTNLSRDHLDFHKSMENYLEAKLKAFEMTDTVVVNDDCIYTEEIRKRTDRCIIGCSEKGKVESGIRITDVDEIDRGMDGYSFLIRTHNLSIRLRTHLSGRFNIMNITEAAAASLYLGIQTKYIREAVNEFCGVEGRMEKHGGHDTCSVIIDYAHTPDALENLLKSARHFICDDGKLILVFGCGGCRDRGKRSIMGHVAEEYSDFCVISSDNSRSERTEDIINDIKKGITGGDYLVIPDREKAIKYAINISHTGDVVVLAGKGHEKYELSLSGSRYFNESAIAERALAEKKKGANIE